MGSYNNKNKFWLREKAEQLVKEQFQIDDDLSPDEVKKVIHDLHIHQIELELQNEELRATQQQLEASRDSFLVLYNHAPMGYLTINKLGIIIQTNQTFQRMLNLSAAELSDKPLANFIYPADQSIFFSRLKAFMHAPERKNLEIRLKRKSGTLFYVHLEGKRLEKAQQVGRKIYDEPLLLVTVNDISERKKRDEEIKFKTQLLEAVEQSVFATDMTGTVLFWNRFAEKLYGWSAYEALGRNIVELLPDISNKVSSGQIMHQLAAGQSWTGEFKTKTKDGAILPVYVTDSPIFDELGKVIGVVGISYDLTYQKTAEAELRKERDFAESLIETAQAIVLVLDYEGRIVRFNPYMERVTGYKLHEVQGKDWFSTFIPKTEVGYIGQIFQNTVENTKITEHINPILTKHKELRYIEWRNTTLKDVENTTIGVLAVGHDISERLKNEVERQELIRKLEDKKNELEQIIYITSHDLRTPLVNIQGFSRELQIALQKIIELLDSGELKKNKNIKINRIVADDIQPAVQFILSGVEKIDSLLAGLLRLSRLGRAAIKFEKLDMNQILAGIIEAFEYRQKEKDFEIVTTKLPGCTGDVMQITQVFTNLMDNAVKYLDPKRKGKIQVSGKRKNGRSIYCIEDNGIGIKTLFLKKIFEIFNRLEPDKTRGEGLGLAIVKRIIERHNGAIWVESEVGKGSKFFVELNG